MKFEKDYYEQKSLWEGPLLDYQKDVIVEIHRIIPSDVKTVLDAGCGNGIVCNTMVDKYDVTAIDISEIALNYVKVGKKLVASIDNLPFDDKSFDLVMVNDVLEHLNDDMYGNAISEIQRVSKGYIIVTLPFLENLEFNLTKCRSCDREFHVNLHKRNFSFKEISSLFEDFKLKRVVFCGKTYQSTITPFISLRHKLGHYLGGEHILCPFCGHSQGVEYKDHNTLRNRFIDVQEYIFFYQNRDLWRIRPDRQEIIGLYERKSIDNIKPDRVETIEESYKIHSNVIFFSRIFYQEELKPFYPYPQYQILSKEYEFDGNMLRIRSEVIIDALRVSFPHIVDENVNLEVEVIANAESKIIVSMYDIILDRYKILKDIKLASGNFKFEISELPHFLPSKYGLLFQVTLTGDIYFKQIALRGAENIFEIDVLKTDGYVLRNYEDVQLYLKTEPEEIKPDWYFSDFNLLGVSSLINRYSGEVDIATKLKILELFLSYAEYLRTEINKLSIRIEDIENQRRQYEELYNQSLRNSVILNEALEKKECERAKAEEMASMYLRDLKSLENRFNELNDLLNNTESLRQYAENMYQNALLEINTLKRIIEEKEIAYRKADESALRYYNELKLIEDKYNELNEKLNKIEESRSIAENSYQSALREITVLNKLIDEKENGRILAEETAKRYLENLKLMEKEYDELNKKLNQVEEFRLIAENSCQNALKELEVYKEKCNELSEKLHLSEELRLKVENEYKGLLKKEEDLKVNINNLRMEVESLRNEKLRIECEKKDLIKSVEFLKRSKVRRVLVLSHMFPHPDQLVFGTFVLDQVKALLKYTDLDVRVISCRPFWMNTYNPIKLREANRVYWETIKKTKWEERDGVKVMYPPYRVGGPFKFITHWHTYSQAVMSVIYDVMKDFRFDLVHAHTAYIDGSAAKLIYDKFRIPYVITEHMAPYSEYVKNPIVLNKSIEASRYALRILCVSPKFREEIASFMPADIKPKLFVYGNGVHTDLFYPISDKNFKSDPVRLSFVGSLDERKNPFLVLRVFKKLRDRGYNVILNIMGRGPLLEKMKEFVGYSKLSDYVCFSHSLPVEEYSKFFRENTDILVHPSRSEGFGVVIIESLSSGKPVVATRCGGPEYIIDDERLGRLVDVDDEDEF
ncbi:MAG: glycosyltransferase, partial [Deltaproteobacteria bacterium]|nr:glycosyltransferase [Deltaproteobacteria bacterium]